MSDKKDIKPKRTFDKYGDLSSFKANSFGHNISATRVYKRTERIIAALYLLTNHISDTEPIRVDLRKKGHELLACALELRSGFRSSENAYVSDMLTKLQEMTSLTRMLYVGGYISEENAHVVIEAMANISQFIQTTSASALAEKTVFSARDFRSQSTVDTPKEQVLRDVKPQHASSKKPFKKGPIRSSAARDDRRALVIETLKKGGTLGIKDIALQIVGYSEKTVQRELTQLVQEGIIKKEGEKRWSKYSII